MTKQTKAKQSIECKSLHHAFKFKLGVPPAEAMLSQQCPFRTKHVGKWSTPQHVTYTPSQNSGRPPWPRSDMLLSPQRKGDFPWDHLYQRTVQTKGTDAFSGRRPAQLGQSDRLSILRSTAHASTASGAVMGTDAQSK